MKLTILSTAFPYRGGIAVFTERLARAFQQAGDLVKLVLFHFNIQIYYFQVSHNILLLKVQMIWILLEK